ncbi:MAG: DNA-3-methyladenine glycosylase 2 family protein [Pseudomonadota bacterium]
MGRRPKSRGSSAGAAAAPAPPPPAERLLDEALLPEALAHLAAVCPRFAAALETIGPPEIRRREGGFAGLLRVLVDQQVSVAAGRAIWARIEEAGAATPEAVLARDEEALRALGLSRPKARYARAAAEAVTSGALCFERQRALPYAEAEAELTAIKGVGPWTASIYHMFCVGRGDLLPAADLALQEAARRLYDLPERPTAEALAALGAPWRPWRSAASLMLWRYYAVEKKREGVS